jgi:Domain of unknown function (DUF4129)
LRALAWLAVVLGLAAPSAAKGRLTLASYVEDLEALRTRLEEGDLEGARSSAEGLRGAEVSFGDEVLSVDSTVVDAARAAKSIGDARRVAARLRRLVAALRASEPGSPVAEPHVADLEALEPEDDLRKGGRVAATLQVRAPSIPEQIGKGILAVYDWIASGVRRVIEWLKKLKPKEKRDQAGLGGTSTAAIAVVAGAALVLALLAWRTLRAGSAAVVEVESDRVVTSAKDEDPLSRETSEWEARARELFAAGHWREAIRAWYHAVLVSLFENGLLHHQKGRTNWEYVGQLSPELRWRPAFLDLTRLFDREWYGRRTSDAEAVRACAESARTILRAVREEGEAA